MTKKKSKDKRQECKPSADEASKNENAVLEEILSGGKSQQYHKIRKYGFLHKLLLLATVAVGTYTGINLYELHKFDNYIIKHIQIAANAPSAGISHANKHANNKEGEKGAMILPIEASMESSLSEARKNTGLSKLRNTAIIWKTPVTDVGVLEQLLDKTVQRSREIEQFKNSFATGRVEKEYPQWIKTANETINPFAVSDELKRKGRSATQSERTMLKALEQLAMSEYGQRIANEYEALNSVVAGGTRTKAKGIQERHKSLLETLDNAAGFRSIIRFQATDYKNAYAHVFVGYLMANMGDLDKGLSHFYAAKELMDKYPDDKNLGILRHTPDLDQRVIKGLINSSITELEGLNKDSSKYSAGWWKRLTYYNQSIGGQANPSIMDIAETIADKYFIRANYAGFLAAGLFYLAGLFARKLKLSKQYEVKTEKDLV